MLAFLSASLGMAQTSAFEGRSIADIQFPNGQPLDPADLARVQPLKRGQPLHSADVAQAIDGLFATGRFSDISVEAEASGLGVIVLFVTQNSSFLGGINVEGKVLQSPNRAQVENEAQLTLGASFQQDDVTQAVDRIQRLLQANGFYEAQITPSVERGNDAEQIFLTFRVHEGKRARYATPSITGATKLPDATILRATGWRIPIIHWWRHVSSSRTRGGVQGILNKYGSRDRLMAKVNLEKLNYDPDGRRVHPDLNIDAGPKVKVTAVETKVSRRVLKRYVPVFQEHAVDDDLLETGKRNLREYFQGQGYYDASVDFQVQPIRDDQETIEYAISRGMRYKLVRVAITGNKYFDTESIRERMFMQPASLLILRHGRYSEAFRRRDEESIANLYRSNGFRDVKVASELIRDEHGRPGNLGVIVHIDEGSQWIVGDLTIHGASQFKLSDLPGLASAAGQPFSEVNIAADRETLLTFYYTRGFPKVSFKATWQNVKPAQVNVDYTIMEGDREYVRDVLTSGLEVTRQSMVDRAITLKPGDPLSPTAQNNIQQALYNLGVFANVETAVENPDGDTDHKYVLYHFNEANRYDISVGFGAQLAQFGTPNTTSLAAPGGTTGVSPEGSLTVSRLNMFGLGHTLSLQGVYSSIEKRASLTYLIPRFLHVDGQSLTYNLLYDDTLNVRTFAARREEVSVQLSKRFSKSFTGVFQASYRKDNVSDIVIPVLLVSQFLQSVRIGMLSANFIQDRRDNPADPHHGIYNTANFGVSGRFFGSQRSFARALVRNATYYSFGKNLVLARQTQFGVIVPFSPPAGIDAEESVPLPERFYAGGADSLRAFPFNQAGPRDIGASLVPGGPSSAPTGFPLGGNALFINNTELRFPFIGQNIQGVLFHDMGNVYSSLSDISFRFHQNNLQDFNYTVHDVGFGIRYRTPVGPIRVDLAYSINPPSYAGFSGTPSQILNCNPNLPASELPSYCQSTPQNISHFQFFFSIGQTF
ncbi:MAG: BamA/TamA family outer membrane protein [Bryobacterales bacterium]|nr:BamA/TamA family outer membrane protein [Bryobacterales bacterium]